MDIEFSRKYVGLAGEGLCARWGCTTPVGRRPNTRVRRPHLRRVQTKEKGPKPLVSVR